MENDPPSPLENIVDDDEPIQECFDWLVDQMKAGRTVEDLTEEMIINGWSRDEAEELAESARVTTRHLRGVITRQEVERENRLHFHKSMRGIGRVGFYSIFGLVFGLVAAATQCVTVVYRFVTRRARPRQ